jgi:hypothetical protein
MFKKQNGLDIMPSPQKETSILLWNVVFGGLAVVVTQGVTVDPVALRPRLSTGLPFIGFLIALYTHARCLQFSFW